MPGPTDLEKDNPHDENGSNFIPPEITHLNIDDGEKIPDRNLTIIWTGNAMTTGYAYRIDSRSWQLTIDTSVTLSDLDEGSHTFFIEPHNNYFTGERVQRNFEIDSIQSPGIYFSPRQITGDSIVSVYFDNISNFMGAHIEITADESTADLGGLTIDSEFRNIFRVFHDSTNKHRLIIDMAYLGGSEGVSGSYLVGSFTVNPLSSGDIVVDTAKTIFRDTDNNSIALTGFDRVRIYQ